MYDEIYIVAGVTKSIKILKRVKVTSASKRVGNSGRIIIVHCGTSFGDSHVFVVVTVSSHYSMQSTTCIQLLTKYIYILKIAYIENVYIRHGMKENFFKRRSLNR